MSNKVGAGARRRYDTGAWFYNPGPRYSKAGGPNCNPVPIVGTGCRWRTEVIPDRHRNFLGVGVMATPRRNTLTTNVFCSSKFSHIGREQCHLHSLFYPFRTLGVEETVSRALMCFALKDVRIVFRDRSQCDLPSASFDGEPAAHWGWGNKF